MDFPDFAPPTVVTQTYKRKRGRGRRILHHTLVPSPLRNGMSISQCGSEEDEPVSKDRPKTTSGTAPPRKTPHSTPPSTPPRKRKGGSQASSPLKSSPSPSKVSIDRELGRIFSPKRDRIGGRQTSSEKDEEKEDDNDSASEICGEGLQRSPRKPSFADRMAPKRSNKNENCCAATAQEDDDDMDESGSQLSEILSSQASSQEVDTTMALPPVQVQESSGRVYRRVRSVPEASMTEAQPTTTMIADDLELSKPCLIELNKRWAELDDLDEGQEEDKPAVDNITGLRARGQSRRFEEDFQYLVLDLSSSQSLADRRSTCVELAKKVLTWEEDGEEGEEGEGSSKADAGQDKASQSSALLTPFLQQLKTTDLTGQMWSQLRLAGAGDGSDRVLDFSFALICLKAVKSDAALSLAFSSQEDFSICIAHLMASSYGSQAGGKTLQRHLSTLRQLAKSVSDSHEEEPSVPALALQILSTLADAYSHADSKRTVCILRVEEKSNHNIASGLWDRIASEAKIVREQRSPDDHAISLVAQVIVGFIDQIDTVHRLDTSIADLAILLQHYAHQISLPDGDTAYHHCDTLCSLLRMIVALMSLEGCQWDSDLIKCEGLLECVVQLTSRSASLLLFISEDEKDRSKVVDPFTLCLALLTDFLVKDVLRIRKSLLNGEKDSEIVVLAKLLKQQRQRSESDANSGYLAGSLSVVLSLLMVGSKTEDAKTISSQEEALAMEQIKAGLHCSDNYSSIIVVLECLVEFAEMVQVASKTQRDSLTQYSGKAKEEKEFFAALIESLTLLVKSHSPSAS